MKVMPSKIQIAKLQTILDDAAKKAGALKLLEAGCGSSTRLTIPAGTYVVGIDISQSQLDKNDILDEKILGDIQTYPLEEAVFDIIICRDVLEHLSDPEAAVRNFARAIKPGGLIILALPNLRSLKGWITKWSPHWFHVWTYKYIFRRKHAGKAGFAPFKTYMRSSIAPDRLKELGDKLGLNIDYFQLYEGGVLRILRKRIGLMGPLWKVVQFLVKMLSLGRLDAEKTDFVIVFSKPE